MNVNFHFFGLVIFAVNLTLILWSVQMVRKNLKKNKGEWKRSTTIRCIPLVIAAVLIVARPIQFTVEEDAKRSKYSWENKDDEVIEIKREKTRTYIPEETQIYEDQIQTQKKEDDK